LRAARCDTSKLHRMIPSEHAFVRNGPELSAADSA
jgi:hypothetical protein